MNVYMERNFRGCKQIGHTDNPHAGVHVRVYDIPNEPELVGTWDGISPMMVSRKHCLFGMKEGISKVHGEADFSAMRRRMGGVHETPPSVRRRVVTVADRSQTEVARLTGRRHLHE